MCDGRCTCLRNATCPGRLAENPFDHAAACVVEGRPSELTATTLPREGAATNPTPPVAGMTPDARDQQQGN